MSTIEPTGEIPGTQPAGVGFRRLAVLTIAAGVVAAVVSWLIGERIVEAYRGELFPKLRISPSLEEIARLSQARLVSALAIYTVMGAVLGLALGAAGGLARGSASAAARAALVGGVLGGIAGGVPAAVATPLFYGWRDSQSTDLLAPLLMHAAIWSAVGAAAGAAFGFGLGDRRRRVETLVGGLAGALAAAIVYEILGALAFPVDHTDLPVSRSSVTRAAAHMLVAVLTAVGAAWGASIAETQKGPAATADPS
ncbi:MAG: hypothetical protein P4L85_22955 [Paludisphaera borealis]|uniref:hypothetical protein n=1 Tax=Paludisphaera borealis TaxID=1387353 RepID=UPI00285049A3|nr:hypothetical protein [Paludisphaera borealis]MDR3622228.1 hypothetical protein [Paludisphaera borealis]